MKPLRHALLGFLLALLATGTARAQTVYTWTGFQSFLGPYEATNWVGGVAPPTADAVTTHLKFGTSPSSFLSYSELYAWRLELSGNSQAYYFQGAMLTTHIGAGGLVYAPNSSLTSYLYDAVSLESSSIWDIQSGTFVVQGTIADGAGGPASITKTGNGRLYLDGDSNGLWTGNLVLSAGTVAARAGYDTSSTDSLGSGTIVFNGGKLETLDDSSNSNTDFVLLNPLVSHGLISVKAHVDTYFGAYLDHPNTLTLTNDTTIIVQGRPLIIYDNIEENGGARKLLIDAQQLVVLGGTNTYTGGTQVANGQLIFRGYGALPATGALSVGANGYLGIADVSSSDVNVQNTFINRFDAANTFGTIGFDTDPSEISPVSFAASINLTGFASTARLGSATHAILNGATITPQGPAYQFGGGGGWLEVNTLLSGTYSLIVDSPAAYPLTLQLTNDGNSYTGTTTVTRSALIIGSLTNYNSGLAIGSGPLTIGPGGYVGFASWGDQSIQDEINSSLAAISTGSVGAVGFEGFNSSLANFDLSAFTGALYLGSLQTGYIDDGFGGGFHVTGTITPAGGSSAPFRFAGYKGGMLQVESALTGTNGVIIGDPNSPATFGDPKQEEYSTVTLTGNNAGLSGNIEFYGGQLGVGQTNGVVGTDPTNALGSGSLIVQPMTLPTEWSDADGNQPALPKLVVEDSGTIIPNNLQLNTDLAVGGWPDFKLAGVISGTGAIHIQDDVALSLSGHNTFSGGLVMEDNTEAYLGQDDAAGTGLITIAPHSTGSIYLETATPVLAGLKSADDSGYGYVYAVLPNTVLTLNQNANTDTYMEFRSTDLSDSLRIVKNGTGTLNLVDGGLYFHHGTVESSLPGSPEVGLQINQGRFVIGSGAYVEDSAPTVWVHGGTLTLGDKFGYGQVYNPVVIDNGGRLEGNGYLYTIGIGAGATLSPGFSETGSNPIGYMSLSHLDALGGGTMEWDIMAANEATGAWDQLSIYNSETLDFSAISLSDPNDSAHRFTLKVISRTLTGTQGLLADFDPSLNYSWLVFDTDFINGFDPAKVILDTSLFTNSLAYDSRGNGTFTLTQVGGGIYLNFISVPEPSTYALLASGLALAGLRWRRRRR